MMIANLLVMDINCSGDSAFEVRMYPVRAVKNRLPEIKVAFLCDKTSDENVAYKVKRKKEEGAIDAFFYKSVQSDYLADALDAL